MNLSGMTRMTVLSLSISKPRSSHRNMSNIGTSPDKQTSIVPILAITRQPSRIPHRDRSLKFLQISFEKMVGDDQRALTASRASPPHAAIA